MMTKSKGLKNYYGAKVVDGTLETQSVMTTSREAAERALKGYVVRLSGDAAIRAAYSKK